MSTDNSKTADGNAAKATADEKAVKLAVAGTLRDEPGSVNTLVIRHDKPVIVYERQKVAIAGILNTPSLYLKKRVALISVLASHVIVNREEMTIELVANEEDYFAHVIKGSLEIHPDFDAFQINKGYAWDPFELADFIRMNRSHFDNIDVAIGLVTSLKTFQAKVKTHLERAENQNGDRKMLTEQVVEHSLPKEFKLNIPVFKGYNKEIINIEVHVRPNDLKMLLISPEAKDNQDAIKNKAIDDEIKSMQATAPDLLITEE